MKKSLALTLALIMVLCMLPMTALAANWDPDDKITITVDVYDQSTNQIYRNVGTDTVTKGDKKIQSDYYQIPALSKFTDAKYGRVEKVTGNWLLPYSSCNVGTNVAFSCNSNNARITYWVDYFTTGGSGTGGSSSEDIDLGGTGRYTIKFSLVYHSNYPDGTDHTVTKNYTVKSYATLYNVFSDQFLSYTDCGFGGYTPKSTEKTWYTTKACTQTRGNIGAENGKTYDLYAGWKNGSGELATPVTVTYKDGSETLATVNALSGDTVTAIDCPKTKQGYTFKGWDTTTAATTVVYKHGDKFIVTSSITLYAVWEENTQPVTPPEKPEPENTSKPFLELTGKEAVKVECTNAEATHADKEKSYGLKPGSYTIGNVEVTAEGGYTCDITVRPEKYVADYVSDPGHTPDPTDQTGKIKLSWNETGKKWELASVIPVVFTVKCDTTVPGSVSAVTKTRLTDVANVPLPSGVDINVEPVVTFTDNNTSATLLYEFTVTGTPGAKVVIKDTGATFIIGNGQTVNDEITVTLPAAVGNETETSTTVYGYRTFSVDDILDGKLVNNATANVESDDNNKKEAKAEVDAKDDRTLKNTLTVKKLVSGNAANTTEKFPFKATFTFPVPGASANPDGVTSGEKVEIIFELAHGQTKTFSYTSDPELKAKIDKMKESGSLSGDGDAVFAMLSYKVEETDTKGYTLATSGNAEGNAAGHNTVTFTNTKNKPNDDHGGHYHPTTTPVPVIVIPPKTGDMPFWYSIAQFLGLVK